MGLVKRLAAPIGAFLLCSAFATTFKISDIQDANLFKKYNTPPVQRVLELKKEFANLDDDYLVNGAGKYMDFILEYSDSLQNPQTREYLRKIPSPDRRNNNEPFYIMVGAALASLGWGAFRVRRYREEKKSSQKA